MLLQYLRTASALLALLTVITGLLYPLLITTVAQLVFPDQVNGSLIVNSGTIRGSSLIGQPFSDPKYFWSRLSATGPFSYNSSSSSGSNYGPLNPALLKATRSRVEQLHAADSTNTLPIPVDLVTASGSGLDPHISIAAALYQAPRVARERNLSEEKIQSLIKEFTEDRWLGFLGEPGVNVLRLNLGLDDMSKGSD